jgi:hypothetical protein
MNTGYERNKTLRVYKTVDGSPALGYPAEYDITGGFGGGDDWYLPTLNELAQIKTNLFNESIGSFTSDTNYWSSTQNDISTAQALLMSDGTSEPLDKDNLMLVRPVRDFTSTTVYALGDFGQAGYIFYITDLGGGLKKYYEAAPVSLETTKTWGLTTNNITGTSATIGTGAANTALIVAVEIDKAANYCDELNDGEYFEALTDNQFAALSTEDYNTRLAAFLAHVDSEEETTVSALVINDARSENTTLCPLPGSNIVLSYSLEWVDASEQGANDGFGGAISLQNIYQTAIDSDTITGNYNKLLLGSLEGTASGSFRLDLSAITNYVDGSAVTGFLRWKNGLAGAWNYGSYTDYVTEDSTIYVEMQSTAF